MKNPYPHGTESWKLWDHMVRQGYEADGDLKQTVDTIASYFGFRDNNFSNVRYMRGALR